MKCYAGGLAIEMPHQKYLDAKYTLFFESIRWSIDFERSGTLVQLLSMSSCVWLGIAYHVLLAVPGFSQKLYHKLRMEETSATISPDMGHRTSLHIWRCHQLMV